MLWHSHREQFGVQHLWLWPADWRSWGWKHGNFLAVALALWRIVPACGRLWQASGTSLQFRQTSLHSLLTTVGSDFLYKPSGLTLGQYYWRQNVRYLFIALKGRVEYFWSGVVLFTHAQLVCFLLQMMVSGVTFRGRGEKSLHKKSVLCGQQKDGF